MRAAVFADEPPYGCLTRTSTGRYRSRWSASNVAPVQLSGKGLDPPMAVLRTWIEGAQPAAVESAPVTITNGKPADGTAVATGKCRPRAHPRTECRDLRD